MMLRAILAAGLFALAGPANAWARDLTVALTAGGPVHGAAAGLCGSVRRHRREARCRHPPGRAGRVAGRRRRVGRGAGRRRHPAGGLPGGSGGEARLAGGGRPRPHDCRRAPPIAAWAPTPTPPCCRGTAASSRARRPGRISGTSPRCRASAACAARRAARWRSRCSPTAWRPRDVYRTLATNDGVERAFRRLDQLAPYIVWWTPGDRDALQLLGSGEVLMTSAPSSSVVLANRTGGHSFGVQWSRRAGRGGLLGDHQGHAEPRRRAALPGLRRRSEGAERSCPRSAALGGLAKGANDGLPPDLLAVSPTATPARSSSTRRSGATTATSCTHGSMPGWQH